MLVDYHIHTVLCNHASGAMEDYVKEAIRKGIRELGFAEHSPWMIQKPGHKLAPTFDEMEYYIEQVKALQERYNRPDSPVTVRLGIEADFIPNKLNEAREYIEAHDFDFVIGSIHHLNGWGFDDPQNIETYKEYDIREVYERYFALLEKLVDSGLADIIGHLDLTKKFGFRPKEGYTDLKEHIAKKIAAAGLVVELNTSGFDKPVGEFYPDEETLKFLYEDGGSVILSSDAHAPEEVGRHFDMAIGLLKRIGFTSLCTFKNRSCIPVSLL